MSQGFSTGLRERLAHLERVRDLSVGDRVEGTLDNGVTGTGAFGTIVRDLGRGSVRVDWDNGHSGVISRVNLRAA